MPGEHCGIDKGPLSRMTTRFSLKMKFLAATLVFGVGGAAGADNGQWFTSGGGPSAAFYSPLKQINTASVQRLGLAWQYSTNTYRGMEATPTENAGMLYVSGIWGIVYALDAATGKLTATSESMAVPNPVAVAFYPR